MVEMDRLMSVVSVVVVMITIVVEVNRVAVTVVVPSMVE
jgi:hypothetical protein